MQRAYFFGARLALRCGSLVSVLWLVGALFGAGFALASGYWLAEALDGSLASRTLLYDLDPNVFIDLYRRQGSGFRMLIAVAALMGAVYFLLWCWLHGVVILSAQSKGEMDLAEAFRQGIEVTPRMFCLMLIATVGLVSLTAIVGSAAWWAASATVNHPSEMTWYYIGAGAVALWLIGYVLLVAIHDHARIRACATGEGAGKAYLWAVGFVFHGGERAFLLAVLLNLTALAVWGVYQGVNANILVGKGFGVASLLLWGEVFLYARMFLRVWFFGAQSDLQSLA